MPVHRTKNNLHLTILIFIFFASGFSSLAYQVAWQRILTLYYSIENISTTLIVSVYMLGLGLGAIIGGQLAERIKNKILFYFLIELLIGCFGFVSIPFLEILGRNTAGSSVFVSFLCMFLFLCIPTILMGMTLPLLTKIFNGYVRNFLHSLSQLYFINTLGAAAGAVVTSYIFISFWGLDTSVYIAATINISIALLLYLSRKTFYDPARDNADAPTEPVRPVDHHFRMRTIYLIVFITGFIAIGYEIAWFRIIGVIVKASAYSFSTVLFIYLLGIALGSYFMKKYLSHNQRINRKNLFFTFQVLISVYVIFSVSAYCFLVNHVPAVYTMNFNSFNNLFHPSIDAPYNHRPGTILMWLLHKTDIIIWPSIFILVPTLIMGASFPLVASLGYTNDKEGDTVGNIYFFNVLGNVTGGLVTGLVLLGALGTEYTLLLFSFIGAMFLFFHSGGFKNKIGYKLAFGTAIVILSLLFFPKRQEMYAAIHPKHFRGRKILSEGTDAVIMSYQNKDTLLTYINGMTHGGRPSPFFYYEALKSISYTKDIKKVLVIGFGTGSTVEALEKLPSRPAITLIELNRSLLSNLNQVDYTHTFLTDDHLALTIMDGRKFLYNNKEKFDAIFIDPLRTTTSFSNNLYSRQFFSLVKDHLNHNGIFMLWMDEHNVVPKTLCDVFNCVDKYSFFAVSSNEEVHENTSYKLELFKLFPANIADAMSSLDANDCVPKNKKTILLEKASYPVNDDYKPHCEYYLGLKETVGRQVMLWEQ